MEGRRFIEETFPIKEVSIESAKEKSIRHGHISTLHMWWARRPLASSRAINYAALVPAPKDTEEGEKKRQFIIKLSKWENSLDHGLMDRARKDILEANAGKPPRVLDPFAGGGAIPLEALRLGCETYAGDYNPVATLILKCTVEYPRKYGGNRGKNEYGLVSDKNRNQLLEDVKKWGKWILDAAKKEIGKFYPEEKDGSIPVGYIWARTITCQNPSCNTEIPLMRQYWLAKKNDKKISLYPSASGKGVRFKILGTGYDNIPKDFDPNKGTISRAVATCMVCGSVVGDKTTRKLFEEGKSGQRMIAVVLHKEGSSGKKYRVATDADTEIFKNSEEYLKEKREFLMKEWGIDPIPEEEAPGTVGSNALGFRYNFLVFGDYFNSRQKLALITFADKVRQVHKKMLVETVEEEYARAVSTYLAIIVNRLADKNANLVVYNVVGEKIEHVFGRQAIPMVWDYVELNPFTDVGWPNMQQWVELVISHCSSIRPLADGFFPVPELRQYSATELPYPDNFFDAIFTDPPYYDNVSYGLLSDFFYVWLKRTVGSLYPELFSTPLTPKTKEIIADKYRWNSEEKAKQYFEETLKQSFKEIRRVLKPDGIATIVYAHKSTDGWETLINSMLGSGLVVTSAWPLHTEREGRLVAQETASLASSIYMIARNLKKDTTGFYGEVKDQLTKHLNEKLDKLWSEGISGADFFVSAIGSSIEVFGKYEKIIDDEGNVIRADKLLEDVRRIVTDYAVKQVLHNGIAGEISPTTRFYVLWRWAYGDAKLEFDDARKLAQGVGIDLAHEWNKGFIRKDKGFIRVLGPEDRDARHLEGSKELIDVLHNVVLLWKKGKNDDIVKVLKETGFGKSDVFYRVAQAISESLPNESKEKKLLEGFLSGRERISGEVRKGSAQARLFE